jgi:hypothetical protein
MPYPASNHATNQISMQAFPLPMAMQGQRVDERLPVLVASIFIPFYERRTIIWQKN